MSALLRNGVWSQMVVLSTVAATWAGPPAKTDGPIITPSTATTRYTEPLDADGYVDLHAALNAELGRGVSASENAAIPLLQAMGPCERRVDVINQVLAALGAAPWTPGMPDFREFGEVHKTTQAEQDEYGHKMGVPWMTDDFPLLADTLKANEVPLAAIAAAVQKPKYFRPMTVQKPSDTLVAVLLPDVQCYRGVARQLSCRAMLHIGEGRLDEARQDLLTCHRLGRCVAKGATLIEALVGYAIDAIASYADNVWAAHPELTPDQIAAYRKQLAELPPVTDMSRCIDLTERTMCLDVTQAIARGKMRTDTSAFREVINGSQTTDLPADGQWLDVGRFANALMVLSVDWNVTLQTLNSQFDELSAAAAIADRNGRQTALGAFENQLKATKAETASFKGFVTTVVGGSSSRGKTFGNVLGTLLVPAVWQALQAQDQAAARTHMLQIMLALAEHQLREGAFPESLAALSPKYLPAVPNDVMSGKPFRYSSNGATYRLYSVGRNGRDDNGQMGKPEGSDDVLMAYPPPVR